MNILVCFKITPDLDRVLAEDWEDFSPGEDLGYARKIINCFDESALELGLLLKDARLNAGQEATCTALCAGPLPPQAMVRTLYAAGFDRVVFLESAVEFAPAHTAACLAEYIEPLTPDVVLTGRQAPMGDSGLVPLLLAGMLGLPVLTEVEAAHFGEGHLVVDHDTDNGRRRSRVARPVLLAVGNSPVTALRLPTLRQQMAVKDRIPEVVPCSARPAEEAPELYYQPPSRTCQMVGGGMGEQASFLGALLEKGGAGLCE